MKLPRTKYPLVRLPRKSEFMLALIKEDLKNRKFFNGLRKLSLEDCYYESDIGRLVFICAGFDEVPDELFNFYQELIESKSKKIEAESESIAKRSLEVFNELMVERKKYMDAS